MTAVLCSTLLLVVLLLEVAQAQPLLTSSAISGYVCRGETLSFNCRGNASGLTWIYKSESRSYPPTDNVIQEFSDSFIYTVLLERSINMIVSTLIFLKVGDVSPVFIQCFVSGVPSSSSVNVIRGTMAPLITNYTINETFATVHLDHNQREQIERFDIILDGERHSSIHNSQNQAIILIQEYRTYKLQIVAVDFCNNANSSNVIRVRLSPTNPTTHPNATEPVLTATGAPSLDERCSSVIEEVWEVSYANLALLLLNVIISGLVFIATVISCKKCNGNIRTEKNSVEEKVKDIWDIVSKLNDANTRMI